MSTASKINCLRRKRDNHLDNIQFIKKGIDDYQQSDNHDVGLLKTYEDLLKNEWKRFQLVQEELDDHDEEDNTQEQEGLKTYISLVAQLRNLIKGERSSTLSTPKGSDFPATKIPLPKLEFPIFDGKLEEWDGFYQLFCSTIDDDHRLTPVHKFLYLRSVLTGEAADCVNGLPLSDENYITAIAILKDRFEHPRYIALRHSHAIVNYPKITKESPTALWHLICSATQNLLLLQSLGEQTNRNAILIGLISSKLPANIIQQWELTLPNKEVPRYTHLLDFLENLALISISSSEVSPTKGSPDQPNSVYQCARQRHAFAATQAPLTCPICQGPHTIWRCDNFKAKPISERLKDVTRASLCINCLKKGHSVQDCNAGLCRRCGQRHHTMLHRAKHHARARPVTSSRTSSPSVDPRHPPHHLIRNLQQTTNRRHHERTRPQLHPPAIDEYINSDADNRRFQ